jgi:hypothetical protein
MKELAKFELSLVRDRGLLKWRVNLIKRDRVVGFLRPIKGGEV